MNPTIDIVNRIQTHAPQEVLKALQQRRGHYTDMRDIFHCILMDRDHWVGVAGDGANGSYEYFSLNGDKFECSDVGYGDTAIALRDILTKEAR